MAGTQKDHHVTDSKNHTKTVPVSSVTPGVKTEAVPKDQQDRTRKLVTAIATTAIPVGKLATVAAKIKVAGTAKTIESGEEIAKIKKFVQGKKGTEITEAGPKSTKMGERQPLKGTEVTVKYPTRKISQGQAAWQAEGLKTMGKANKKLATAKGIAIGASGLDAASTYKKSADKKK